MLKTSSIEFSTNQIDLVMYKSISSTTRYKNYMLSFKVHINLHFSFGASNV